MSNYHPYLTKENVDEICRKMDEQMSKLKTKEDCLEYCKKIGYDIERYEDGRE